ncbi:MAG: YesL family protein [Clostridia bacterium]|nr:YesL family protein [Clostridia bacterium]
MRFLSYDSKFGQLFLKLSYGCCLNVMWLICCLPIVTIGASTTALYYTSFKIAKDEGSYITTMFFRSFKQNFKQATIIWLIMLGAGALIVGDAILLSRLRDASAGTAAVVWTLLLACIFACMIAYVIVLVYIFPLLSIASNTTVNMFKNAFLIGTHYLFVTILVVFIHYAMFFLVVNVFTPLIIFGEGLCAVISAHVLLKILRPLLYDPNAPENHKAENAIMSDDPGEGDGEP